MVEHNILSESEQMYLLTLALLSENGLDGLAPLSLLAAELKITAVSANQMVRKLSEAGLLEYQPYKGVGLTGAGWQAALGILRHRRLWEVFLCEKLHFPAVEAEGLACRLEHVLPHSAAERLAEFLGHPSASPQGKPIPPLQAEAPLHCDQPLNAFTPGETGRITQLQGDQATRNFLAGEGLQSGLRLQILGVGEAGAVLVETAAGGRLYLSPTLAGQIWLEKTE